ncbi:hypothetical protein SISNIDRAFT_453568 [Sistotremastrum niveocremeum HHB9708]|nr:hypothetical protein SISNIDRAFT_453568 [Sistotremastrum niveocremeum HHB9708]
MSIVGDKSGVMFVYLWMVLGSGPSSSSRSTWFQFIEIFGRRRLHPPPLGRLPLWAMGLRSGRL